MNRIVELSNVHKEYPLGKVSVHALRGVSLSIEEGDFVTIAGPSGSGKTTLLNHAPMSTKALHSRQSVNDFNFIGPTFKQPLISKKVFPG